MKRSKIQALLLAAPAAVLLAGCSALPSSLTSAGSSHHPAASPNASASSPAPAPATLAALQSSYEQVVRKVEPSVVQIETQSGLGSGIVFDQKGDIVTNDHVVGGAQAFNVTLYDGKQYQGKLVGAFPADDLAVIHIQAPDLKPAVFADSSKLQVGQIVLAIGNPLGLKSSVTQGIVSAVGRTVSEGQRGTSLPDVVQTSAAINPGNSGGALVDLKGRVVGIPTLAAVDSQIGGSAPGIGFAISSNMAHDIAQQIVAHGHVVNSHRAYLGIEVAQTGGQGALVAGVKKGGPADQGGLKPGDVITAVNGHPTPTAAALSDVLAQLRPGDKVSLLLTRANGGSGSANVTLGQFPG